MNEVNLKYRYRIYGRIAIHCQENFGIATHYDSDMGIGFGINLNYY